MNRKDEHLFLAQKLYEKKENDFDGVHFVHHSLPQINMDSVDISTHFLGRHFKLPFYINAMTGGSENAKKINQQLGILSKETGILVALGSLNEVLRHPEVKESYTIIRKENPNGRLLANLGANTSVEKAKKAIDLIQADGLQVHLNAPQELVMPEGDRDFYTWLKNIETLVNTLEVPIIVKEVGFGMSLETIHQLKAIGVKTIDVSGRGGTSFTEIENARREKHTLDFLNSWGQSTALSLLEAATSKLDILASGGVRNSLDIVKALSLGAKSVGIAGTFLNILINEGLEKTIEQIAIWEEELRLLYTLLGKSKTSALTTTDLVFNRSIIDWCESRGIPYKSYAKRSTSV